jgi:hypothetical protein
MKSPGLAFDLLAFQNVCLLLEVLALFPCLVTAFSLGLQSQGPCYFHFLTSLFTLLFSNISSIEKHILNIHMPVSF